jgi:hypothetical protein
VRDWKNDHAHDQRAGLCVRVRVCSPACCVATGCAPRRGAEVQAACSGRTRNQGLKSWRRLNCCLGNQRTISRASSNVRYRRCSIGSERTTERVENSAWRQHADANGRRAVPDLAIEHRSTLCFQGSRRLLCVSLAHAGRNEARSLNLSFAWIRANVPYSTPELMERYIGFRKSGARRCLGWWGSVRVPQATPP